MPPHPTPSGPSDEQRWWQRNPGAAAGRGGRRPRPPSHTATALGNRPESVTRQHAGTSAAPPGKAGALGLGPGSPCTALGPDPGAGDGFAAIPRLPARARPDRTNLLGPSSAVMCRKKPLSLALARRAPARLTSTARSPCVAIIAAIATPLAPPPAPHAHGPVTLDWAAPLSSAVRGGGAPCATTAGRDFARTPPEPVPAARWVRPARPQPSAHQRRSKRAACKNTQMSGSFITS